MLRAVPRYYARRRWLSRNALQLSALTERYPARRRFQCSLRFTAGPTDQVLYYGKQTTARH